MKATQAKKLKAKILRIRTKQTKAKLPQYKARNSALQGSKKFFLDRFSMSRSCAKGKTLDSGAPAGDSPRQNHVVSQYTLKRRKKKVVDEKEARHSVDIFVESSTDSAEARSVRESNNQRYRDDAQQRNIGSPVIVEALSESLTSLSLPEVFKQRRPAKSKSETSLRIRSRGSRNDEARVVVVDSLNPSDDSRGRRNDKPPAPPVPSGRKPRRDTKQSQTGNGVSSHWKYKKGTPASEERSEHPSPETDEQNNTLEAEVPSREATSSDQDLVRFYCLRNKVVVVMSEKARFCFTGKLLVRVLHGAIEAYGCVVTADSGPVEIYSPRGYSNVCIETSDKFAQSCDADIWATLSIEGVDRQQRNKLVTEIEQITPGTTVALLSNLENKLTKFLHVFYPIRLFPKITNTASCSWTDPKRAETILQSHVYPGSNACKELIVDPRIAQELADKMLTRWRGSQWSCACIAGGKSVGKSTTTRYLINRLLPTSKMVVLLDVDPGQAECTPAGCISYSLIEQPLMGPNFTHLGPPVFQLYIGDVNVSRCIPRYIEGVKMLVDRLSNCPILSRLPVVVNTMGFSQGIGWDIALFTIKLLRPSFVVQIMSEKPRNNYMGYLSKQVVNRQKVPWATWSVNVVDWREWCDHELVVVYSHAERKPAPGYDTWNMEPYQQRDLALISYLSGILPEPDTSATRLDALSLSINEAVPYVTSFASLCISIPGTSVPATHVLNVLNGNIVALCGIDASSEESRPSKPVAGPKVLNTFPLCACYGFGIVRGMDVEREEVYINAPLPAPVMRYVNCLVGCIPVPIALLETNRRKNVPYTGGNSPAVPMGRQHRRGYFRMRYEKPHGNP